MLNQRGETVLYCEHILLVEKKELAVRGAVAHVQLTAEALKDFFSFNSII